MMAGMPSLFTFSVAVVDYVRIILRLWCLEFGEAGLDLRERDSEVREVS